MTASSGEIRENAVDEGEEEDEAGAPSPYSYLGDFSTHWGHNRVLYYPQVPTIAGHFRF